MSRVDVVIWSVFGLGAIGWVTMTAVLIRRSRKRVKVIRARRQELELALRDYYRSRPTPSGEDT